MPLLALYGVHVCIMVHIFIRLGMLVTNSNFIRALMPDINFDFMSEAERCDNALTPRERNYQQKQKVRKRTLAGLRMRSMFT